MFKKLPTLYLLIMNISNHFPFSDEFCIALTCIDYNKYDKLYTGLSMLITEL